MRAKSLSCVQLFAILWTVAHQAPLSMEFSRQIKKNSFESILMRWMKLEPIIQSEVSQKDKDHYNILTLIYGI